jgi:hypothetical protein
MLCIALYYIVMLDVVKLSDVFQNVVMLGVMAQHKKRVFRHKLRQCTSALK